jgi:hypothetical protein
VSEIQFAQMHPMAIEAIRAMVKMIKTVHKETGIQPNLKAVHMCFAVINNAAIAALVDGGNIDGE